MEDTLLTALVWTNYKLFLLLCLLFPVGLSIWGLFSKIASIQRLMLIYWRVASLLAIAIYLFIPVWQIGYIAWFVGHFLIVIGLWFWVDVNDEINDLPKSPLKLVLTSWRWATSIYGIVSAIAFAPFLGCTFSENAAIDTSCRVWLQAPWHYKSWFHPNATTGLLGFLGMSGLIIYGIYFLYFLAFRLVKQGRIAIEQ